MGPLLARCGEADVSLPGGCAIGERPVDIHLSGFEAMGAKIDIDHGYIKARAARLSGAQFPMRQVSVGATANLMMGAVLAKGTTVLENCAMEPDIVDLGNFLIKMGAKIKGLGTERIAIEGVRRAHADRYTVMPDRIEAGTYLLAGAITRGDVTITKAAPGDIEALTTTLRDIGFIIDTKRTAYGFVRGKASGAPSCARFPIRVFPPTSRRP